MMLVIITVVADKSLGQESSFGIDQDEDSFFEN